MSLRIEQLVRISSLKPLIIAHRGLSWEYPENSLLSFQAAVDAGADMIELDVRTTSDGTSICAHDDTIDRYLNKDTSGDFHGRAFSSLSWNQLKQIDVGSWKNPRFAGTTVPRFTDVLELFAAPSMRPSRSRLLIEHKQGTPQQMLEEIAAFDLIDEVIVQSFDTNYLARLHVLEPKLALAILGGDAFGPGDLQQAVTLGARAIHWNDQLRRHDIEAIHAHHLPVWIYTLNSELAWCGASDMQIDAITTDRCDVLREIGA